MQPVWFQGIEFTASTDVFLDGSSGLHTLNIPWSPAAVAFNIASRCRHSGTDLEPTGLVPTHVLWIVGWCLVVAIYAISGICAESDFKIVWEKRRSEWPWTLSEKIRSWGAATAANPRSAGRNR